MIMQIMFYDHSSLKKKTKSVYEITDDVKELISNMIETMESNNGTALAAPQFGKSLRIFVLKDYLKNNEDGKRVFSDAKVFINPTIIFKSEEMTMDIESCLSVPGVSEYVSRPNLVRIEALNIDGNVFVEEATDFNARVRFHEIDHLNGVLFIHRIDDKRKKEIKPLLKKIKSDYPD